MLRINGGEVSYGRTIKTGDFENKRVDVKISFSVDEGDDDYETLIAMAGNIACHRCHNLLGLDAPKASTAPLQARSAPALPSAPASASAPAAAVAGAPAGGDEPKRGRGRPPKPKPAPADELSLEDDTPAPAVAADDLDLDSAETTAQITDKDLEDAIRAHNAKVKNGVAIKKLIGDFTPKGQLVSFRVIPQEDRAKFLSELTKVPAL